MCWGRVCMCLFAWVVLVPVLCADALPGTIPLKGEEDLAARMVAGIDAYLMRRLAEIPRVRQKTWKVDVSSPAAYNRSLAGKRARLRYMLGVVEERVRLKALQYVGSTAQPHLVAQMPTYTIHAVRWPVLPGIEGEGLLLEPRETPRACVVAIPDADTTPEMLVGLARGVEEKHQFARRLVENGCRVVIPVLINRQDTWSGNPDLKRMTNQPHREFIYRMAYEMGRHIIGYEVQKVLALVDWFTHKPTHPPVGIYGYGEGGLLALYSAALDTRIESVVVSGYFGPRENIWQEPIYRNVFGLLREFGDAELAAMVAPRHLLIEPRSVPDVKGPPSPRRGRRGAAPGMLTTPTDAAVAAELARTQKLVKGLEFKHPARMGGLSEFLRALKGGGLAPAVPSGKPPVDRRTEFDPTARQKRQFDQLVTFTQKLMRDSRRYRDRMFWAKLDTTSVNKYEESCEPFREQLWEVMGKLPAPTVDMKPRTRQVYDEPKWKGYQVVLDVYPDVFAYGILLIPKDIKAGERRPVVVCQHGLEGRPRDVVNPRMKTRAYNSYGATLADLGYIVYAPQNPYIGRDRFRVLQRKANPLGLSLFSFIIHQHERTLAWLGKLPFVDSKRIAFYGLSYGGKTAMRVPALVPGYCLSICSGDFNEWIEKNVSVTFRGSYMFTIEYEMPEFNLGHTFNYAEMAALIAPRPFMVERGHDDGVGIDEMVAYEYAKVRRLYSRLGLPERTRIEYFAGRHEINGKGTYEFLHKHLRFRPQ